ncbi:hypothetical protein HPB47_020082, partial [Ixodes persulcatus]
MGPSCGPRQMSLNTAFRSQPESSRFCCWLAHVEASAAGTRQAQEPTPDVRASTSEQRGENIRFRRCALASLTSGRRTSDGLRADALALLGQDSGASEKLTRQEETSFGAAEKEELRQYEPETAGEPGFVHVRAASRAAWFVYVIDDVYDPSIKKPSILTSSTTAGRTVTIPYDSYTDDVQLGQPCRHRPIAGSDWAVKELQEVRCARQRFLPNAGDIFVGRGQSRTTKGHGGTRTGKSAIRQSQGKEARERNGEPAAQGTREGDTA